MIAADALTNPWVWRQCHHVYDPDDVTPRRCLACKAIDHGTVQALHMIRGGMSGYRLTDSPFMIREMSCINGHPATRRRSRRDNSTYCLDCQNARRKDA